MNKTIKHNLTTKPENLKGKWANDLPEVFAYGYKAMVPVELGAGSLRWDSFDLEQNMILQRRELNFLEEKWRDSQLQVVAYQRYTT